MNKPAFSLYSLLLIVGLILPACSRYRAATTLRGGHLRIYPGPLRPKEAVGYLTCAARNMDIAEIDSVTIKEWKKKAGFDGGFSYLELLPGRHTVLVKGTTIDSRQRGFHTNLTVDIAWITESMGGESLLEFVTRPGHVYLIKSRITRNDEDSEDGEDTYTLSILVEDVKTKDVVGRADSLIRK